MERLTKDLNKFTEERESAIKKLAKADGRLKELTHGKDLREIITSYNDLLNSMLTYNSKIDHIFKELMKLYKNWEYSLMRIVSRSMELILLINLLFV